MTLALLLSWLVLGPLLHRTDENKTMFNDNVIDSADKPRTTEPGIRNQATAPGPAGAATDGNPQSDPRLLSAQPEPTLRLANSPIDKSSENNRSISKNRIRRSGKAKSQGRKALLHEAEAATHSTSIEQSGTETDTDAVPPSISQAVTSQRGKDSTLGPTAKTSISDSTDRALPEPQDTKPQEKTPWQFWLGPQWEMQIPTTGTYGYFHGPDNSPEAWRYLVPGIWLEAVHGKDALNLSFMPMHQQMVNDEVFRVQSSLSQTNDTTISREDTKHLYKLLGASASLGYARNLRGAWWGGLSFQAAWWRQALAVSDVQLNYFTAGQAVGQEQFSEPYSITNEWEYFNRMQTFVQADLTFRKQRWQSGLRTGISLTPLSRQAGPGHLFRASAFFRFSFGK
jgi:hypothetical protein